MQILCVSHIQSTDSLSTSHYYRRICILPECDSHWNAINSVVHRIFLELASVEHHQDKRIIGYVRHLCEFNNAPTSMSSNKWEVPELARDRIVVRFSLEAWINT